MPEEQKMSIRMVGIDHNRANVDIRALFSFTKKGAAETMELWKEIPGIRGCIILSTCNRMEIWASTDEEWAGSLLEELCKIKGKDPEQYRSCFVCREGREAADHLFHLTCGLKSMILAEDQIISQVKDALSLAREHFTTDNVLEVLFRKAVTAGKKVKTNVVFSHASQTAMDQAVEMLRAEAFDFSGAPCMVIGNGEMGKLAAQTLKEAGASVTVTVRQYRSGIVSIPSGCSRINYGERLEKIPSCRVVVSATSSPNYTLTREQMEQLYLPANLILIDLAVPRDIEPSVGQMPGIRLYTIDDFKRKDLDIKTRESLQQAEEILKEEMDDFYAWLEGRDMIPRIQEIQQDAVTDLNLRLHKILQKLPLQAEEKEELEHAIDIAAGKVVGKMLFGLRDALNKELFSECVEGLEKLYEE